MKRPTDSPRTGVSRGTRARRPASADAAGSAAGGKGPERRDLSGDPAGPAGGDPGARAPGGAPPPRRREIVRRGVPVSPGFAIGPAHVIHAESAPLDDRTLAPDEIEAEIERLLHAVRRSRDEIAALRECLLGEAEDPGVHVLEAHLLILGDGVLLEKVQSLIRDEKKPASTALSETLARYISTLEQAKTEYFRGRAADIRDVERRILHHLNGRGPRSLTVPEGAIVVAEEISPSEAAAFDPERIRGLVVDRGGATSHAAILARARGIPAVVGLRDLSRRVQNGDLLLVDGEGGQVVLDPRDETREAFEGRARRAARRAQLLEESSREPAVTADGAAVRVCANIETRGELPTLERHSSDGIGLFRTEYFFLGRSELPGEEEQFESYRDVVRALDPLPVTLRVLDVGGDKFASFFGLTRSENPFLGVRGIRFLLDHPEILRTQVRAILRASVHGNVRILFPMISSVEEMRQANHIVDEERDRLKKQGLELPPMPRGAMVETPAAVLLLDLLAAEADFFSIGSNDLIQYTLAVDRGNQNVAHLYDPYHPAVLRILREIVVGARRADRPVSCCGEMAGDLYGASILLGLGCLHLSVSPAQIPRIKDLIRRSRLAALSRMMGRALDMSCSLEVRAWIHRCIDDIVGAPE